MSWGSWSATANTTPLGLTVKSVFLSSMTVHGGERQQRVPMNACVRVAMLEGKISEGLGPLPLLASRSWSWVVFSCLSCSWPVLNTVQCFSAEISHGFKLSRLQLASAGVFQQRFGGTAVPSTLLLSCRSFLVDPQKGSFPFWRRMGATFRKEIDMLQKCTGLYFTEPVEKIIQCAGV